MDTNTIGADDTTTEYQRGDRLRAWLDEEQDPLRRFGLELLRDAGWDLDGDDNYRAPDGTWRVDLGDAVRYEMAHSASATTEQLPAPAAAPPGPFHGEDGSDAILNQQGGVVGHIGNGALRRRALLLLNVLDEVPDAGFEQTARGEMSCRVRFVRVSKRRR